MSEETTICAGSRSGGPRWAAAAFFVAAVAAVPVILYSNREQWFFFDEWDFLSARRLDSAEALLDEHNAHWSTVPIIGYRILYRVVGLHHYWPYQMLTITAHLASAVLLRVVMRRAGVPPWLSTASAVVFLYFGTGRENIGWAFQIGFTGALAFGLGHLLLSDHDGPFDRRDALGLLCGLLALMCSNVGVAMAVSVTVAVLIRRGWRAALAHGGSLGVVYIVWVLTYGGVVSDDVESSSADLALFVRNTVTQTFVGLGQSWVLGLLIGLALVVGCVVAIAGARRDRDRRRLASTAGLVAGAVTFVLLAGTARATLSLNPASRYRYVVAALALPAIAVAVSALARHWRPAAVLGAGLLLAGLPGNVAALEPSGPQRFTLGSRGLITVLADTAVPPGVPATMEPLPLAPGMTVGWLRAAGADGKVPRPDPDELHLRPSAVMSMSLQQLGDGTLGACRVQSGAERVELRRGEVLRVRSGWVAVSKVASPIGEAAQFTSGGISQLLRTSTGHEEIRLLAVTGPLTVRVRAEPGFRLQICTT
jgi:hypothetical protein